MNLCLTLSYDALNFRRAQLVVSSLAQILLGCQVKGGYTSYVYGKMSIVAWKIHRSLPTFIVTGFCKKQRYIHFFFPLDFASQAILLAALPLRLNETCVKV